MTHAKTRPDVDRAPAVASASVETDGDLAVQWISAAGVEDRDWRDVRALLDRKDGFVWIDVPSSDADKAEALLERRVREGDDRDPVRLLEEMFLVRHELLAVRTMAAQSREVYARMAALTRMIPPEAPPLIGDLLNRFEQVTHLADGEKEFMQGVIDFYQARTTTRMNVAMERLALIAAVLLPVTAIASIYGMNLIVGERTEIAALVVVLEFMGAVIAAIAAMLAWTRRMGWW